MARKSSTAIPGEELEVTTREPYARSLGADESPLDQRMLDLEEEAESPFLRGQKRVPRPPASSTAHSLRLRATGSW